MPLPRFTLRQIHAFVVVAELKSFTDAGDRMALTPSAVSQLVAELEAAVGFRLFERSTRRVGLSAAGSEFLPAAELVLKQLHRAESAASDLQNRAAGIVSVAAPLVVACALLPLAIKAFGAQRPNVVVRIRDTPVERLADLVASGEAHLAVGVDVPTDASVERLLLFPTPWVLWCSPEHPLARKRSVLWSDLRSQALVAAGRDHETSVTQMLKGLPEHDRVKPLDVVDNISTALGMAAANLAPTLAPAYVEALARPLGLTMRRILDPEVVRQVSLYLPATRSRSPAAEGFAEFIAEWLPRHVRKTARWARA